MYFHQTEDVFAVLTRYIIYKYKVTFQKLVQISIYKELLNLDYKVLLPVSMESVTSNKMYSIMKNTNLLNSTSFLQQQLHSNNEILIITYSLCKHIQELLKNTSVLAVLSIH